jgi:hypothetical protein
MIHPRANTPMSSRTSTATWLMFVALALTGCAAAAPGYSPDPPSAAGNKILPTMQSGSVDKGAYQPSDDEKKLDCRKLTGSMHVMLSRLKDAPNRPRPSGISTAIQGAAAPVFKGSTIGSDFEGELARERLRLDAYNKLLAEKKCKTMDVEAELKKPR